MSGLAERLALVRHRGEGLLLRLYHARRELADVGSDVAFLRDRHFQMLAAAASAAAAKNLHEFVLPPKLAPDVAKTDAKIRKYVVPHYETLVDAASFVSAGAEDSCLRLMSDCASALRLDAGLAPDLTEIFLDVMVAAIGVVVLLARLEERRLLCVLVAARTNMVCELVSSGDLSQPLLKAYSLLRPFQPLISSAFLPAAVRAYVNLRGSCDQWCKEDFLCPRAVFAAVGIQDGGPATSVPAAVPSVAATAAGNRLDTVDVDRLERWIFFAYLICHNVVDVADKDSGEYRIWTLMLQGMWIVSIIRDEVLHVHDELARFFKSLKPAFGKHEEHGANKKAAEMRSLSATALSSSPEYHRRRRHYLAQQAAHYCSALAEDPRAVPVAVDTVIRLLSLCRAEVAWLARHQDHLPSKKSEVALLGPDCDLNKRDPELVAMLFHMQELRTLLGARCDDIRLYFEAYVCGFDVPSVLEVLNVELAKINDPYLETNPLKLALDSLNAAMELMIEQDHEGVKIREGCLTPSLCCWLRMDCLRLQAFLCQQVFLKRPTSDGLAKALHQLNSHVGLAYAALQGIANESLPAEIECVLFPRSALFESSDLSVLAVAHSGLTRSYFATCAALTSHVAVVPVLVEICEHAWQAAHPLCPEDEARVGRMCAEAANFFLKEMTRHMLKSLSEWTELQWSLSSGVAEGADSAAVQVHHRLANRKARKDISRKESVAQVDNPAPTPAKKISVAASKADSAHAFVAHWCRAFGHRAQLRVGAFTFTPAEFLVNGLDADFAAYVARLSAVPPSMAWARVQNYLSCALTLGRHLDGTGLDMTVRCSQLLAALQIEREAAADDKEQLPRPPLAFAYLDAFRANVIAPIVEGNSLVFSETFRSFVALPREAGGGRTEDASASGSTAFSAAAVSKAEAFVSQPELVALAMMVGPIGINYLVRDVLESVDMMREARLLKDAVTRADVDVSEVLQRAIRLGCLLALRDLLLKALQEASSETMPLLGSAVAHLSRTSAEMNAAAAYMGQGEFETGETTLTECLCREDLFCTPEDFSRLMCALAVAIPQAAAFWSSRYVLSWKSDQRDNDEDSAAAICVDGHANQLNCVAWIVSHLFTALFFVSTGRKGHPADDEDLGRCFDRFLQLLSNNLLQQCKPISGTERGTTTKRPGGSMEATLLLVSLVVEHCPRLGSAQLQKALGVPLLAAHAARNGWNCVRTSAKRQDYRSIREEVAATSTKGASKQHVVRLSVLGSPMDIMQTAFSFHVEEQEDHHVNDDYDEVDHEYDQQQDVQRRSYSE